MNITTALQKAEQEYKSRLEDYLSKIFSEVYLPSHGTEHHRRVWHYAKELAAVAAESLKPDDSYTSVRLIIACYLHDAGMAYDTGESHGAISRKLCEEFIADHNLPPALYDGLPEAIEAHDDKDYLSDNNDSFLRIILNSADDLDALGFIGIYRYLEIYIARGIPFRELGVKILRNVTTRFDKFSERFGSFPGIYKQHTARYRIIKNFCENYIRESEDYLFDSGNPEGYCGIAEITGELTRKRIPVNEAARWCDENSCYDAVILWFFNELRKELLPDSIQE